MRKLAYKICEWLIEKYDLPYFPKLIQPVIDESEFFILNLKCERILLDSEIKYSGYIIQELKSELLESAGKHITMKVTDDPQNKIVVQLFVAKRKA